MQLLPAVLQQVYMDTSGECGHKCEYLVSHASQVKARACGCSIPVNFSLGTVPGLVSSGDAAQLPFLAGHPPFLMSSGNINATPQVSRFGLGTGICRGLVSNLDAALQACRLCLGFYLVLVGSGNAMLQACHLSFQSLLGTRACCSCCSARTHTTPLRVCIAAVFNLILMREQQDQSEDSN